MKLKSPWTPRLAETEGSVSDRLAAALSDDIADGHIAAGARLPAHRSLAYQLGIGIGTVTKAYSALERRGLVRGAHGRGMFVAGLVPKPAAIVDLSINVPPTALTDRLLASTLQSLAKEIDAQAFSTYQPVSGTLDDRRALAAWLSHPAHAFDAEDMLVTHGAQHALAVAFSLARRSGATMITESVTYPGALALARQIGLNVMGVQIDDDGLDPKALRAVLARVRGDAFVYTTPTLHNPSGRTQGTRRRQDIARLCRDHDVLIVEDEIYAPLLPSRLRPIASFAPERTLHVAGLSKVLCPGLRVGVLVVPPRLRLDAQTALEASATMSSPLSGAIARRWLADGTADDLLASVRHEARRRQELATRVLGLPVEKRNGFHLFIPLDEKKADSVRIAALECGVVLTPSTAMTVDSKTAVSGLRICLGGPTMTALDDALQRVQNLLDRDQTTVTVPRRSL